MKKLLLIIAMTLGVSCLPYIEKSIEHFGVKGQLVNFPNRDIQIKIQPLEDYLDCKVIITKTESNGHFKIKMKTVKYLTYTISGPILLPPSQNAKIYIYSENNEIYSASTNQFRGFFDLGKIINVSDN